MPMPPLDVRTFFVAAVTLAWRCARAPGPKGQSFKGVWFVGPAQRDRRFHRQSPVAAGIEVSWEIRG